MHSDPNTRTGQWITVVDRQLLKTDSYRDQIIYTVCQQNSLMKVTNTWTSQPLHQSGSSITSLCLIMYHSSTLSTAQLIKSLVIKNACIQVNCFCNTWLWPYFAGTLWVQNECCAIKQMFKYATRNDSISDVNCCIELLWVTCHLSGGT